MAAKRKRVTLNEFKAWLEGVEELQEPDWFPTSSQWQLIRTKIDNIKEEVVKHSGPAAPTPFVPVANSLQPIPGIAPAPQVGGIPANVAVADMTPAAKAMLDGSANKTVTPNIDTADGNYQSSFN